MSRYRAYRRKQRKLHRRLGVLGVGLAAFAALSLFSPKKSEQTDVRTFNDGIKVQLNRTSPPFAALEDTLSDLEPQENEASPFTPMILLSADSGDFTANALAIASEQKQWEQNQAQAQLAAERRDAIAAPRMTESEITNVRVLPEDDDVGAVVAEPGSMLVTGGRILALEASTRVATADGGYEHPTREIRLAELNINRAELLKSLFFPIVAAERESAAANVSAKSAGRVAGLAVRKPVVVTAPAAPPVRARGIDSPTAAAIVPPAIDSLVIAGPLEMTGGLAVTSSQDQLVVYREVDGEPEEAGHVWMRDGRYEIYVARSEGLLVAELQTPSGDVLGRGTYDLAQVRVEKSQAKAEGIQLMMKPVVRGLRGVVKSAYSHGTKTVAVPKAEVAIENIEQTIIAGDDGKFHDKDLAAGSIVITRTRASGFWGTLAFAASGSDNTVTLYPDRMMNAFVSLMSGGRNVNNQSIVWGRVTRDGEPIAGAKVELVTGENEIKPVYFNALLIPDPALTETTANGLYAFFPVDPGVHAVQASFAGSAMDPVLFPTEAGFVSSIDLEAERNRTADITVFDAFRPDRPVSARVAAVGNDSGTQIGPNGKGAVRFAAGQGILTLEADGGDSYAVTRIAVPRDKRSILMPMISKNWLNKMRDHRRISREPETGAVVGFVQAKDRYQVYPQATTKHDVRVVYFDGRGAPLRTDYGVPGGGYAIFNLPEGFSTVSIIAERMNGLQAITTLVDGGVVNVVNHSLR